MVRGAGVKLRVPQIFNRGKSEKGHQNSQQQCGGRIEIGHLGSEFSA